MTRTLVAYAGKHGSTEEVAVRVAQRLCDRGHDAELKPAWQVASVDDLDCVVLGGALYMGRWHANARRFVRRHALE